MFKKFFYISATLLLLVATHTLIAHRAQAQDPMHVRWVGGGSDPFFATSSAVYVFADPGWKTLAERGLPEPPITVGTVLFYNAQKVVSTSGEAFYWLSDHWVAKGSIPGGTIAVQPETWTGVKEKYRK